MDNNKWEPWVWYSDIWPTKAKFYTWVRGALRNAVWNKSPIKITFKNNNCIPPPDGYTGKAKSGNFCALCGEWEGKSKLEVDHISGNVSLQEEDDILKFFKHLVPPPNSLQLVKKEAHKIKSYAEKQGISFEEAQAKKKAISICKNKEDISWLEERGIQPQTSATKRRKQIEDYLISGGI